MCKFEIYTDSSCDLENNIIEKYGIKVDSYIITEPKEERVSVGDKKYLSRLYKGKTELWMDKQSWGAIKKETESMFGVSSIKMEKISSDFRELFAKIGWDFTFERKKRRQSPEISSTSEPKNSKNGTWQYRVTLKIPEDER